MKKNPLYIQMNEKDNVVVATHDLEEGTQIMEHVVTRQLIPQAHKIALCDIPKGGEIIRYGVVLGYAKDDIPCGSWINEFMLELPQSPSLENLPYEHIRWIANKEEINLDRIQGTSDMKKVMDLKGNPLLLFVNPWSVGMVQDRNKDLVLTEFSKN